MCTHKEQFITSRVCVLCTWLCVLCLNLETVFFQEACRPETVSILEMALGHPRLKLRSLRPSVHVLSILFAASLNRNAGWRKREHSAKAWKATSAGTLASNKSCTRARNTALAFRSYSQSGELFVLFCYYIESLPHCVPDFKIITTLDRHLSKILRPCLLKQNTLYVTRPLLECSGSQLRNTSLDYEFQEQLMGQKYLLYNLPPKGCA